jgi:hypothetical protein
MIKLWAHQKVALAKMHNGCVLVGGTGSGKSLTALSYHLKVLGGSSGPPTPLYIITTAKKRDDKDWERDAGLLGIEDIKVDSWNNIKKYSKVSGAMFIFDEQRLVGKGVWVRSFYKIAKKNQWVLLSATPADTWMDLIPVFVANGFYRNRTEFIGRHVRYAPYVTFPKITGFLDVSLLTSNRDKIFVLMPSKKHTIQHIHRLKVDYNIELVKFVLKNSWNPFKNEPIDNLSAETHINRRIINMAPNRIMKLLEIQDSVKRLIIFYNFNFELEILRDWFGWRTTVAEWNGWKHNPIPNNNDWVYLVQYAAAEAWECFETNHMAFYSLNYSYRKMHQARGRIDRHNTPYTDLYYYELVSDSYLDIAIQRAFGEKKDFNINMLNQRKSQRLL